MSMYLLGVLFKIKSCFRTEEYYNLTSVKCNLHSLKNTYTAFQWKKQTLTFNEKTNPDF